MSKHLTLEDLDTAQLALKDLVFRLDKAKFAEEAHLYKALENKLAALVRELTLLKAGTRQDYANIAIQLSEPMAMISEDDL